MEMLGIKPLQPALRPPCPDTTCSYGETKRPEIVPPNDPAAQPKSVPWVMSFPPLTEESFPLAVLKNPPLTEEAPPSALFPPPPLTEDCSPLALLPPPPLTEAASPTASLVNPPLT